MLSHYLHADNVIVHTILYKFSQLHQNLQNTQPQVNLVADALDEVFKLRSLLLYVLTVSGMDMSSQSPKHHTLEDFTP